MNEEERFEKKCKRIENEDRADDMLYEFGFFEGFDPYYPVKKGITYVKPWKTPYAKLLPIKVDNSHVIIINWDYKSLIQNVIENNFNIDKVNKIIEKVYERIAIDMEKRKINERQHKLKLREKAEKEYSGKEKTKRRLMDNEFRESIFNKFNNECAVCGAKEGLHIHHKDENPSNNQINNLIVLCGVCHKKVHMKIR